MRLIICLLTMAMIMSFFYCSYAQDNQYDIRVRELYADADGRAKVVYLIPIEVKLLDISEDANWYKVYLKFNIGPIEVKNTGWAYIPIGNILIERAEKSKVAQK